jgi:hypothetical protein
MAVTREMPAEIPRRAAMAGLFRAAGWSVRIRDPAGLVMHAGRLRDADDGKPVDIVLRYYLSEDPGARMIEDAHEAGLVLLVDPVLPHGDKGLFELIDDPAVPWTRILCERTTTDRAGQTIDLLTCAERCQGDLVIKPSHSFGGCGVLIGSETDTATWRERLNGAQSAYREGVRFVVQERLALPQARFPMLEVGLPAVELYWDRNPVLCDGRFAGFTTRVSHHIRTGAAQGSSWVPAFVLPRGAIAAVPDCVDAGP